MNSKDDSKYGLIFWSIISLALSCVLFIFYFNENKGLLVLSLIPLLSLSGYLIGAKVKGNFIYFPRNVIEYSIENLLFLGLFILSLFLFGKSYLYLKVLMFLIMSAVGTFNTYFLIKKHRHEKTF